MRLKFTRRSNGEVFEIGDLSSPFTVSPETALTPQRPSEVLGYEFSGQDGGYNVASRYTRRALDLVFNISERWDRQEGITELVSLASTYFDPHMRNLTPLEYDIEVYTDDKNANSFELRGGVVSAPLFAPIERGQRFAKASVSFIFADPYQYWLEGSAGANDFILYPSAIAGSGDGRAWTSAGATWTDAGATWRPFASANNQEIYVLSQQEVFAQIEVYGEVVNPSIINTTLSNSSFSYAGTIANGSVLKIDRDGNVTLNGQPSAGAGRVRVTRGMNNLIFNASANNSNAYARVLVLGKF